MAVNRKNSLVKQKAQKNVKLPSVDNSKKYMLAHNQSMNFKMSWRHVVPLEHCSCPSLEGQC